MQTNVIFAELCEQRQTSPEFSLWFDHFYFITMILLHLLVWGTVVSEKAADELFHKNSHLEVLMS
ncbi:hypothetical protein D5695_13105 [Salmonella enterica subsp. enterica serovar Kentucky]|nr:hypothetical protein [Salmonella enterica subsp. enterica serovar Kentucky]